MMTSIQEYNHPKATKFKKPLKPTIQKYCLIYRIGRNPYNGLDDFTTIVFNHKSLLMEKLETLNPRDVRLVMRGIPLEVKLENRLVI